MLLHESMVAFNDGMSGRGSWYRRRADLPVEGRAGKGINSWLAPGMRHAENGHVAFAKLGGLLR